MKSEIILRAPTDATSSGGGGAGADEIAGAGESARKQSLTPENILQTQKPESMKQLKQRRSYPA